MKAMISSLLEASDKTYIQSKIDISGSNETMQNDLGSIVKFWRIFHPIWTKFGLGADNVALKGP